MVIIYLFFRGDLNPEGGLFRIFQHMTHTLPPSEESKNDIYNDIYQLVQV